MFAFYFGANPHTIFLTFGRSTPVGAEKKQFSRRVRMPLLSVLKIEVMDIGITLIHILALSVAIYHGARRWKK